MQPAVIEEIDDKLYLRAFLLDSSVNKNNWGVSPETLAQNIQTYIGRPLVLNEEFGHPEVVDPNFDHQLQYQEKFRIGNIVDIVNKDSIYSAIIEVTDNKAREAFKLGNLPLFVSPQLFHDGVQTEADNETKTWRGTHLAIVDEPAFGISKARVEGQCSGKAGTCLAQLKRAKCSFCIQKAIDKFIVTNNKQKVNSSLQAKKLKKGVMSEDTKPESKISETDFNEIKKANEVLVLENKNLKEANEKLTKDNTDFSERIGKIENEARTEKIANILQGCYFKDDEARKSAHEAYVKSAMSYDEITQVIESLRHVKSGKVETKLPLKQANTGTSVPDWYITYSGSVA